MGLQIWLIQVRKNILSFLEKDLIEFERIYIIIGVLCLGFGHFGNSQIMDEVREVVEVCIEYGIEIKMEKAFFAFEKL